MIQPNVRGSTGYGKTFLTLDNGIKREDSVKDIGALLDWIARQPDLDAVARDGRGRQLRRLHEPGGRDDTTPTGSPARSTSSASRTSSPSCRTPRATGATCAASSTATSAIRRCASSCSKIAPLTNAAADHQAAVRRQGRNDPRVPYTEAEQIVAKARAERHAGLVPARRERGPRLRAQGERRLPVLRDGDVHARDAAQVALARRRHGRRRHPRPRRGDGRVQPDRRGGRAPLPAGLRRRHARTSPIAAARQGARVGYLSALGDDVYGAMLRAIWHERRGRRQRRASRRRRLHRRSTSSPTTPRGHHFSFFRQRLGGEPAGAGAAAARGDRRGARAPSLGHLAGDLGDARARPGFAAIATARAGRRRGLVRHQPVA